MVKLFYILLFTSVLSVFCFLKEWIHRAYSIIYFIFVKKYAFMPAINLILPAFFLSFFLAVLLLTKKNRTVSDRVLSGYFLIAAVIILLAYLEMLNRNNGYRWPWLIHASTPFIFLLGPLMWLYTRSLTGQHFIPKFSWLVHIVPFVFMLVLLTTKIYAQPAEVKILREQTGYFRQDWTYPFVMAMIALSNVGYTVWSLWLIKRFRGKIKAYFSNVDGRDLSWLYFLLWSALVCYVSVSGLYLFNTAFQLLSFQTMQMTGYTVVSLFILVLGFYGFRQGNVFASVPAAVDLEHSQSPAEPEPDISQEEEKFVSKLLNLMQKRKPHRDPDLTLAGLSQLLGVQPEYLSRILNRKIGMHFFDFVNHYRIEDFKALCREKRFSKYTLLGMAYDCGFNSKATFNRVFKNATGLTPGDYAESVKGK